MGAAADEWYIGKCVGIALEERPHDNPEPSGRSQVKESGTATPVGLRLEAFLSAAEAGDYVGIRSGPDGSAVIAVGRTAQGRRVAWIDDSRPDALPPGMADAAAAFLAALAERYGPRICDIVHRQLELPPAGQPLPAPLVRRAVRLARDSQSLFAGVNFMTRLRLSATAGGEGFREACAAAGIDPASLGAARRELADRLFRQSFEAAARGDTIQVEEAEAFALLVDALRRAAATEEASAAALVRAMTESKGGAQDA